MVSGLIFAGTPGYTYSIIFTTNGIDLTKLSNIEYMNQLHSTSLDMDMTISLRDCLVGEQFTSAGQCVTCPAGTSYSLVVMTSPGTCQQCPTDKAICNGGSNIGPKAGYWRTNNYTSDFI